MMMSLKVGLADARKPPNQSNLTQWPYLVKKLFMKCSVSKWDEPKENVMVSIVLLYNFHLMFSKRLRLRFY